MKIIKPLQISAQTQAFEQDGKIYFVVSATLGIGISGCPLLSVEYLKDAFESMGDYILPDMGMPKPRAEFLITAKFYSENAQPVKAGKVKACLGAREKELYVYGERSWQLGVPSEPTLITELSIDYANAYGGKDYPMNPIGNGYQSESLPQIENPNNIVTSANGGNKPAGFSPLDSSWSQRRQYEGTFDERYLEKYFPGHPPDFDWRGFMTAPDDQWMDEYFTGTEKFELHNMHPEKQIISGQLPGLVLRCFLHHHIARPAPETAGKRGDLTFEELPLEMDTIHFYPEKELILLTARGVIEVNDSDGDEITNVIMGYEDSAQELRTKDYYFKALNRRLDSTDSLLNDINTQDLIPVGHLCAMEIFQEMALGETQESELGNNLDAKSKMVNEFIDEKSVEIDKQLKTAMPEGEESRGFPEGTKDFNLKSVQDNNKDIKPDADLDALNKKLEQILPGITAGDPGKLELKNFSFDKVEEIMAELNKHTDKKQALAMQEIARMQEETKDQLASSMNDMPDQKNLGLQEQLAQFENIMVPDKETQPPIPRINLDEILDAMGQLEPQLVDSMNQLNSLKNAGVDNEVTHNMEQAVSEQLDEQQKQMNEGLRQAELDFKELYAMAAHYQENGMSPHKKELEEVKQEFLDKVKKRESVANADWACIDLSGEDLRGIDLSGAYLEQVKFTGANLSRANLRGAILARATLDGADCSHANFQTANIGAVNSIGTNFTGANFHQAKLSKGNFSESDFTDAILTETETLEFTIDGANFTGADLTSLKIIQREINGVNFTRAKLEAGCFLQSSINNTVFDSADMSRCTWADTSVSRSRFNGANLSGNCFVVTEDEESEGIVKFEANDFSNSRIEKSNFQNLLMPKSNFQGATVVNCNFNGADLSASDLSKADMRQTQFRKARLTGANLRDSNFDQAFFAGAHLVSADLSGSNFYGVDFLGSTIGETKFDGCNLDATIMKDWRPG